MVIEAYARAAQPPITAITGFIGCGQQAADLFCKARGYEKAVRFDKGACVRFM